MGKRSILAALLLPALFGLIVLLRLNSGGVDSAIARPAALPAPADPFPAATAPSRAGTPAATIALGPDDAAFLQNLRDKFGPALRGRHGQIRAIEQVLAYLAQHYPADWRERIEAFLQALSPELAVQLIAQFESLTRYQDWLRDNRERLTQLPAAQRRAELWLMRRELFGAAAAEEIWAAERRGEQVQSTLAALDRVDGRRVDEKLGSYLGAIESAYGSKAAGLIEQRRTELMNRFLELDSVQSQLAAMAPTERSAALRGIRERMGLASAALDRWDGLDRERDQHWDSGQRYQQERSRIVAEYRGAEQGELLRELQDRSFGTEAEVIRSEEASGFYRYAQSRRIGRE